MLSAIINAGGASTRMGMHKALLPMPSDAMPLLAHTAALVAAVVDGPVYVVANHSPVQEVARGLPYVTLLSDETPAQGPLAGLAVGLAHVPGWALVVACDLPLLQPALLRLLADRVSTQDDETDAVVPLWGGRAEGLCAAYHRRCLPVVQEMLRCGNGRVRELLARVRVRYVAEAELRQVDPALQSFINVNTPQEWAALLASGRL